MADTDSFMSPPKSIIHERMKDSEPRNFYVAEVVRVIKGDVYMLANTITSSCVVFIGLVLIREKFLIVDVGKSFIFAQVAGQVAIHYRGSSLQLKAIYPWSLHTSLRQCRCDR